MTPTADLTADLIADHTADLIADHIANPRDDTHGRPNCRPSRPTLTPDLTPDPHGGIQNAQFPRLCRHARCGSRSASLLGGRHGRGNAHCRKLRKPPRGTPLRAPRRSVVQPRRPRPVLRSVATAENCPRPFGAASLGGKYPPPLLRSAKACGRACLPALPPRRLCGARRAGVCSACGARFCPCHASRLVARPRAPRNSHGGKGAEIARSECRREGRA